MSSYCTVDDVQRILPDGVTVGTSLLDTNVNVLETDVDFWIEQGAGVIDAYLGTIYRIPLIKYKEPDFSVNPVTFEEKYPSPIILVNARMAASYIYDKIVMAQQEPNTSDWGFNIRALAFDDLKDIQSGLITLKNQITTGYRFVRSTVYDGYRVSRPKDLPPTQRTAGK